MLFQIWPHIAVKVLEGGCVTSFLVLVHFLKHVEYLESGNGLASETTVARFANAQPLEVIHFNRETAAIILHLGLGAARHVNEAAYEQKPDHRSDPVHSHKNGLSKV